MILVASVAGFVAAAHSENAREEKFVARIEELTPVLETVATGGRWLRGSDVGTFRLVVRLLGFEHQRNHAFLQWIKEPSEMTASAVVTRTVPLPEISGGRVTSQRFVRTGKESPVVNLLACSIVRRRAAGPGA